MNRKILALLAIALAATGAVGWWFRPASPSAREVRTLDGFFSELRPGITEAAFDDLLSRYQFKDGVMFMPVICSIHDPVRHYDTMSSHGIYAFHFDQERKLTRWHPWGPEGTYSSGAITPNFLLVPSPAKDATLPPESK